jgi:hypothetical protein
MGEGQPGAQKMFKAQQKKKDDWASKQLGTHFQPSTKLQMCTM